MRRCGGRVSGDERPDHRRHDRRRAEAAQHRGEKRDDQGRPHSARSGRSKPAKLRQKDRDARWTVKYTKAKPSEDGAPRVDLAIPAFGYKNHIGIDRRHRLIRSWTATDAARHDGALLPESDRQEQHRQRRVGRHRLSLKAKRSILAGPAAALADPPQEAEGQANAARAPPEPMPASRQCARRSSMSSPGRRGRWGCSSAPSASPEREPRSASPTSPGKQRGRVTPVLECAPRSGQCQAAGLTVCRAC